jgi:hypothetical protein
MVETHYLRSKIWTQVQHPYKHSIAEFAFANPALPNVTNLNQALDWLVAVLYPNTQPSVATPADLPTGVDTPNPGDTTPEIYDYRVVLDDGDGKAASYRWEQREGDVAPQWYKIYDMDWGEQSILSNFLLSTQDVYVYKYGISDKDENGDVLTGIEAGQHIFGGDLANQNLTLHANAGDAPGLRSGFIQFDDDTRPTVDNLLDLGTASEKFKTGYFGTSVLVGDLTLSTNQLVSSTGTVDFNDDNLSTTGNITGSVGTFNGHLVLQEVATPATPAAGYNSLYFKTDDKLYRLDSAGNERLVGLEFASTNDNRLVRSDGTGGSAIQESGVTLDDTDQMSGLTRIDVGNLALSGNAVVSTNLNGNISLTPNGSGSVVLPQLTHSGLTDDRLIVPRSGGLFTSTGVTLDASDVMGGITQLNVDNIRLDGNVISSQNTNGNIVLSPDGIGEVVFEKSLRPITPSAVDLGLSTHQFGNLYLSGNIGDGSLSISMTTLLSFRDALVGAANGHTLFYDGSKWNSSVPDTEVDHGTISGLLDDDHTQYLLLSGRSGGQEAIGGTDAADGLILSSTSNATRGSVLTRDNLIPFTDANFTTSWQGTDLGDATHFFRDIYSKGEHKGLRVENFTSSTLPSASANNVGRIVYATDNEKLYVDVGGQFKVAGIGKFISDEAFNGVDLTKTVDVSSNIQDARNCQIQLLDNANNFERIYTKLEAISASDVRITTNVPLPAGSYRLIVIE